MIKLILKFQDTVIEEHEFDKPAVTIGRREDNDIVIDNMAVSGHHALIEKEEPNFYAIADLDSLNGTYVNETKIRDTTRLFDRDVITVGKHVIEFEDLRPQAERPARPEELDEKRAEAAGEAARAAEAAPPGSEEAGAEGQPPPEEAPERPKKIELYGSLTIISGGIPQIIDLDKRLTTIGKSEDADIKCSGLLVGKNAALINKRPNGYFLAYGEGMKKPDVNGEQVSTQVQLHDGDEISIGNTRMTFNLREVIG